MGCPWRKPLLSWCAFKACNHSSAHGRVDWVKSMGISTVTIPKMYNPGGFLKWGYLPLNIIHFNSIFPFLNHPFLGISILGNLHIIKGNLHIIKQQGFKPLRYCLQSKFSIIHWPQRAGAKVQRLTCTCGQQIQALQLAACWFLRRADQPHPNRGNPLPSTNLYNYVSICLSVYLSICLSVCLSTFLSVYLSIYLSACVYLYILGIWYLYVYIYI